MSTMQNPFVWHDLLSRDVEGAKKFYKSVVGWNFEPLTPEYTTALVDDVGVGGILNTPPELKGTPPFWSGYIYTADVDAACAKIRKLGGKILREPWDIPDMLRVAVVSDPTGAYFNIMKSLTTQQRKLPKEGAVGTVGWNELHAGDLNTAWDFYSEMFGWTKGATHDMGPMGIYQLFQIDSKDVGGMMKKTDATPMPTWSYYFNVDGIDPAAARITKAGGKIAIGPHQVPGGQWIVSAQDLQGAFFHLLSETK